MYNELSTFLKFSQHGDGMKDFVIWTFANFYWAPYQTENLQADWNFNQLFENVKKNVLSNHCWAKSSENVPDLRESPCIFYKKR
jgi:hypothetical protein